MIRTPIPPRWRIAFLWFQGAMIVFMIVTLLMSAAWPADADDRVFVADMIMQQADDEGVPSDIALAVAYTESRFIPDKIGRAGELGVFQLKLSTAKAMGFTGTRTDLLRASDNITFGLKHLRLALIRGAAFHQAGLNSRSVSAAYVAKIERAMKHIPQ